MKDTKNALISATKKVVGKYGLENVTTRKICAEIGVNDGLIYHYFKNLNELICTAYMKENGEIFDKIMDSLAETRDIPFSFYDKNRLIFHRIWALFLSDTDRTVFLNSFYHSFYYKEIAGFHQKQVAFLVQRLGRYFKDEKVTRSVIYLLMTLLYGMAQNVIVGVFEGGEETENEVFGIWYGLLSSQLKPELLNP